MHRFFLLGLTRKIINHTKKSILVYIRYNLFCRILYFQGNRLFHFSIFSHVVEKCLTGHFLRDWCKILFPKKVMTEMDITYKRCHVLQTIFITSSFQRKTYHKHFSHFPRSSFCSFLMVNSFENQIFHRFARDRQWENNIFFAFADLFCSSILDKKLKKVTKSLEEKKVLQKSRNFLFTDLRIKMSK